MTFSRKVGSTNLNFLRPEKAAELRTPTICEHLFHSSCHPGNKGFLAFAHLPCSKPKCFAHFGMLEINLKSCDCSRFFCLFQKPHFIFQFLTRETKRKSVFVQP